MTMNASDIVAVLSGVGTMVTAIYIGVSTYRDKTAEKHRKAEEQSNKLLIEDMLRSVEFNKTEVTGLKLTISEKELRIKELETQFFKMQSDCQERSLELIKSLNIEKEAVLSERTRRIKAESEIAELHKEIDKLRLEVEELKKKFNMNITE